MLDREQRELLVVAYTTPPAPRLHFVGAVVFAASASLSLIGLALADYSAVVTAWLIVAATLGFAVAAVLFVTGVRARRQFRVEMQRADEPVPVQPAGEATTSVEVI